MLGGQLVFLYVIAIIFLFSEQPLDGILPKSMILNTTPSATSSNSTKSS